MSWQKYLKTYWKFLGIVRCLNLKEKMFCFIEDSLITVSQPDLIPSLFSVSTKTWNPKWTKTYSRLNMCDWNYLYSCIDVHNMVNLLYGFLTERFIDRFPRIRVKTSSSDPSIYIAIIVKYFCAVRNKFFSRHGYSDIDLQKKI